MDPLSMEEEMETTTAASMGMSVEEATEGSTATSGSSQCVGEFELGRTLGVGATGKVKLGTHRVTGLKVAIKIISKDSLNSKPNMRRKMEREIAVLRLVNHPNVMKLFDVYETSRYLFLILEYVEGGELFDYLVRKGRLLPNEALRFFQQIVLGVDYCHKHMVCHRDLKPENLLLDENNNVKLADFGMASVMKQDSLLETSCGSPHYACPEVVMGQPYSGEAADVWSMGVILYALLTGRLPFDDENIRRLLKKVKAGRFFIPRWVSPDINDLISRMLTVDPTARITVDEIKAHPWFNSLPMDTPPVRPISEAITSALPIAVPDDDVVASLVSLGWGGASELRRSLASDEKSVAKVFYHLLAQRKAEIEATFHQSIGSGRGSGAAAAAPMDEAHERESGAVRIAAGSRGRVGFVSPTSPHGAQYFPEAGGGAGGPVAASYIPSSTAAAMFGGYPGSGPEPMVSPLDATPTSLQQASPDALADMDVEPSAATGVRVPRRPMATATPLSQSVPTSNAFALASSYGVPVPVHPPAGWDGSTAAAAAGAGGVSGTPRFHRHAGAAAAAVAASPPVSSSPHVSWFSNLFGGSQGGQRSGVLPMAGAAPTADAASVVTQLPQSANVAQAPAANPSSRSAIVSQLEVVFHDTTPKALGTKVALALHGARCKFRRNSFTTFKAKCNYGGVILKFKIIVQSPSSPPPGAAASALAPPPTADVGVTFLLQAGLPESFAGLVNQLASDIRALQSKPPPSTPGSGGGAAAPDSPPSEHDDVDLANMDDL
ncbi:CAMK/CAMKL/BRSK protein kinase [Thecamonas trahens ATCC 50062]|uniref:CAMK/CAMKL/BRSK protein kinase n=1 Tax=Thecamonas trahens ATCC 50062 TaxID=461836 RepID=A0A0L0DIR0_THETB|nr:CAMK/CAMKL/BRSK protein kinase [Thecamonas trahens ATCC 50062]KNC52080.1 CAMK/CAMKL/BRSK protein kinase [Thecamonas trahens ATCC 50062]|eukprot:XP_013762085.1 CAMK/CAMKL/BRSK protein kinase [Thecamonas trahens ATCC 50062]